tara:strand:+ start:329 stop:973 length:645 start_codon:yes stop_codon:yes gene_type:complete
MSDYIKIYDAEICDNTTARLERLNLWKDGRDTTTGVFKTLKKSVEMDGEARYTKQVTQEIVQVLIDNNEVEKRCFIHSVNGLLINKYETGGHYGGHYDSPEIGGTNHHYSFTIFLNDNYRGGELVVEGKVIKPKQGHIYIYPSDKFHSVNEVTYGTRYAIIGWIKSRYPEDHIRENIRNMLDVREFLLDTYGMDDDMYQKSNKTLINLMRHYTL